MRLRAVMTLEMLTPMKSLKPPLADDFAIPVALSKSQLSRLFLFVVYCIDAVYLRLLYT
jgi:hypothetical protein